VVSDPAEYPGILEEMRASGGFVSYGTRKRLATEVFRITSAYDNAIWQYLSGHGSEPFPEEARLRLDKIQELRYGENPHQDAAFYRFSDSEEHTLARATQVQGKELSYNNILDADACWTAVREFEAPACVIVKHMNPCGVAVGGDLVSAYQRAYESDPVSAYGGVIAFNGTVTPDLVRAIFANKQFVEVMVAPEYEEDARLAAGPEAQSAPAAHRGYPSGGRTRVARC